MLSDATLERYRIREKEIAALLSEIGECPFCGNVIRHDDECVLAPVEVCGLPVPHWTCPLHLGHSGECWQ